MILLRMLRRLFEAMGVEEARGENVEYVSEKVPVVEIVETVGEEVKESSEEIPLRG